MVSGHGHHAPNKAHNKALKGVLNKVQKAPAGALLAGAFSWGIYLAIRGADQKCGYGGGGGWLAPHDIQPALYLVTQQQDGPGKRAGRGHRHIADAADLPVNDHAF